MSQWKSRMIGATLGAVAAMSIGGAGLAFAQTADDNATTTEAPAVTEPAPAAPSNPDVPDREDCPDKAGDGGSSSSDSTTTDGSTSAGEV